ncbi:MULTISPECIES: AbiTii domain-containing protein [Burkholderia]|uniref:Response regulator n=2 Tax=Burkholderia multivorans TaxID=87883 RepID=A0A0H3KHN7_BURM1|nr:MULTISPECIES: hypothetical protein [Burkholderia]ABX14192.1 conserved hypothetical protein [Burkholderia multivorans ATCC 17616]AIO75468.1 response regulator [Burkholderia multivorans]MBJ9655906.1 hypothetical protein [Burkholderia multivorans]MBJ9680033.1 hypothetical protein [Burkholderia multivorans]MBU9284146.1 hypothetical protein [Burkholderia multivorans]
MRLLGEVIDLLSANDGSLTGALLKTKVLMHRIGHKELAGWVNDELNGYKDENLIPTYRVVRARIVGNVMLPGGARYRSQTLPTAHLPEDIRQSYTEWPMPQSISVLETLAAQTQSLSNAIAPEIYGTFGSGYEAAHVTSAWRQIEPGQVQNIVVEVRSRLLDFVLNLQDQIGDVPESDMKEAAKTVDASGMFNNAMFGDNVTVVIGHGNVTTSINTVQKRDFDSLSAALKKAGVDDEDVEALRTAISDDDSAGAVVEKDRFGPKVQNWFGSMIRKAASGGWTIGLSAAGAVLAAAINAHYGFK